MPLDPPHVPCTGNKRPIAADMPKHIPRDLENVSERRALLKIFLEPNKMSNYDKPRYAGGSNQRSCAEDAIGQWLFQALLVLMA